MLGSHRACAAVLVIAAHFAAGCAAEQSTQPEMIGPGESTHEALDPGERIRRMAGIGVGLEVRRWSFLAMDPSDERLFAHALASWRDHDAVSEQTARRLERNGLRLFLLSRNELETLEQSLGRIGYQQKGWYGQMVQWEPLVARRLTSEERAVVIDGRVRRFDQHELALMMRSWIAPMEGGPRLLVQFVPTYDRPDDTGYRRILGRDTGVGRSLAALKIEVLAKPDQALVLISEAPGVVWQLFEPDDPSPIEDDRDEQRQEDARENVDRSADEQDELQWDIGPGADTPRTLGELLLGGARDGSGRGVLIFVPHVAPDMLPLPMDDSRSEQAVSRR